MTPEACPFCNQELIWRSKDEQWIHPAGEPCIMAGIGLRNSRQIALWNRRDGEEIELPEPVVAEPVAPVAPPPPPPRKKEPSLW